MPLGCIVAASNRGKRRSPDENCKLMESPIVCCAAHFFFAFSIAWLAGNAAASDVDQGIAGEFVYKHQVRDYHLNCDSSKRECAMLEVKDKVTLLRQSKAKLKVLVATVGNDLHVCSFEGNGRLSKGLIVGRSNDPTISCEVTIRIIDKNTVAVLGTSKDCESLCGAMARFQTENLSRIRSGGRE